MHNVSLVMRHDINVPEGPISALLFTYRINQVVPPECENQIFSQCSILDIPSAVEFYGILQNCSGPQLPARYGCSIVIGLTNWLGVYVRLNPVGPIKCLLTKAKTAMAHAGHGAIVK